jgi:hypothetical protein
LAATSRQWQEFTKDIIQSAYISEIAAKIPCIQSDGLIVLNSKRTFHFDSTYITPFKLWQILGTLDQLAHRKKHTRYPRLWAEMFDSPSVDVDDKDKIKQHNTIFFCVAFASEHNKLNTCVHVCLVTFVLMIMATCKPAFITLVKESHRLRKIVKENISFAFEIISRDRLHPTLKKAFDKYSGEVLDIIADAT